MCNLLALAFCIQHNFLEIDLFPLYQYFTLKLFNIIPLYILPVYFIIHLWKDIWTVFHFQPITNKSAKKICVQVYVRM